MAGSHDPRAPRRASPRDADELGASTNRCRDIAQDAHDEEVWALPAHPFAHPWYPNSSMYDYLHIKKF